MSTIQIGGDVLSMVEDWNGTETTTEGLQYTERGLFEISGTGELVITNTGGSSASEGGMGSGSDDETEKGSLDKPGEKSGQASANDDTETTFDPLKKSIKEAEKERDKE